MEGNRISEPAARPGKGEDVRSTKAEADVGAFLRRLPKADLALLVFFCVMLVSILGSMFVSYALSNIQRHLIIIPVLGGQVAVFFITGIPAFIFYVRKSVVSTAWIMLVVAVLSFAFMVSLYETNAGDRPPPLFDALGPAAQFAFFYLFSLLALVFYIFVAFGMMWFLSFLQRLTVPDGLSDIRGMTAWSLEKKGSAFSGKALKVVLMRAVFNIPSYLDTRTLRVDPGKRRERFPMSEFLHAAGWTMTFGVFITVLIVLNPFLRELPGFQDVFGLSALISFFIPFMVLSWFIFKRLDARIKGPVKDFRLFEGLRARITRSVLAFSTLIIFVRLAIENMNVRYVLWEFFKLFMDFVGVVIITTFVYFNYFEEELASAVAKDWEGRGRTGH